MSKKKKNSAPPVPPESLNLPPGGADSHAHLDDKRFAEDLDAVIARARASGISLIGNVFTYEHKGKQYVTVTSGAATVYAALGGDPNLPPVPPGSSVWTFALK